MSSDPERKTVLIVDDDAKFAHDIGAGLDPGLWEFKRFERWKEASTIVPSEFQPDVAIIDPFPENDLSQNGIAAIRQLAERLPHLPIIALTDVRHFKDSARNCLQAGAINFLTKPIEVDELSKELFHAIWIKERQVEAAKLDRLEERDRKKRLASNEGLDHLDEQDQYVPTVSRLLREYPDRLHQMQSEAASVVQRMHETAGLPNPSHRDAEWLLATRSLHNLGQGFRRIEAGLSQLSREVSQRLEHGRLNEAVRIDWVVRLADLEASLAQTRDDFSSKEMYLAQINPSNSVTSVR